MAQKQETKKKFNLKRNTTVTNEGLDTRSNKVKVRVNSGRKPHYICKGSKVYYFNLDDTVETVKEKYKDLYDTDAEKLEDIKFYGTNGLMADNDKLRRHTSAYVNGCYIMQVTMQFQVIGGSKRNNIKVEEKEKKIDSKSKDSKDVKHAKDSKKDTKETKEEEEEDEEDFFDIKQKPKYRERNIDHSNTKHRFSNKECIISLEKDPKNNVYMNCKHTINSQSMFRYLLRVFNSNSWQYEVYCPVSKCKTKWNFSYCAEVACLNEAEWLAFNDVIIERSKPETKTCPNCKNYCEKPDLLNYYRVACICDKGDWCWECGKKWIGGGFTVCGNKGCITNNINDILKNCGQVKNPISGKFKTQALRACPFCHHITEHASECKHMNCKGCGKDFCFVCLKGKDSKGKWLCSSGQWHMDDCGVAPIQVLK